jgi:hypothetical protein
MLYIYLIALWALFYLPLFPSSFGLNACFFSCPDSYSIVFYDAADAVKFCLQVNALTASSSLGNSILTRAAHSSLLHTFSLNTNLLIIYMKCGAGVDGDEPLSGYCWDGCLFLFFTHRSLSIVCRLNSFLKSSPGRMGSLQTRWLPRQPEGLGVAG